MIPAAANVKRLPNSLAQRKSHEYCRKIANMLYRSDYSVVLDDEKYCTFDGSFMPGNDNFLLMIDDERIYHSIIMWDKKSFLYKILVSIAFSSKIISMWKTLIMIGVFWVNFVNESEFWPKSQ